MTEERTTGQRDSSPLLAAVTNLSKCRRDHEKLYAAPLDQAAMLRRRARSLLVVADRWSGVAPMSRGESDQLEGPPIDLASLKDDLRSVSDAAAATAEWLEAVMETSWVEAEALLDCPELADVLGERHRIIANDWQAASLSGLAAKLLRRSVDLLDRVDVDPAGARKQDTTQPVAKLLYSAAEMVGHAAHLLSDSAALDGDNEPRWRAFRSRVNDMLPAYDAPSGVETVGVRRG